MCHSKKPAILRDMNNESRDPVIREGMERFLDSITSQALEEQLSRVISRGTEPRYQSVYDKAVEQKIFQTIDTHYYRYKKASSNAGLLATELLRMNDPALWSGLLASPSDRDRAWESHFDFAHHGSPLDTTGGRIANQNLAFLGDTLINCALQKKQTHS